MPKTQKPKMLVVDDEPDNIDLLYRTFRRDYQVFRAASGSEALDILAAEGEVAVIISDQRMPEMKGTEFLSKTVPEFPDTVRIILTGFTDIEDLVEAINAGQVYRYITKPWDPEELKTVVTRAAASYDQLKQRDEELQQAEKQLELFAFVAQLGLQPQTPSEAAQQLVQAIAQVLGASLCSLLAIEADGASFLTASGDAVSAVPDLPACLRQNPLVQQAIATQTAQASTEVAQDPTLAELSLYQQSQTRSHLVAPIIYQGQPLALLSLQWPQAYPTLGLMTQPVSLLTQQMAAALVALQSLKNDGCSCQKSALSCKLDI
ncbi:MAG: response regulator [Leptolyngbya sp. SIO4C1]|nr:response regulator [Leptolyngbya sp. SIO4C1]